MPSPDPMPSPALPLICALLRGESPAWPPDARGIEADDFLREARYHGVTPLLDARFRDMRPSMNGSDSRTTASRIDPVSPGPDAQIREAGAAARWPDAIRRACREDALVQAMNELVRRDELVRVLGALAASGVTPLVLKGGALAYTHYPSPALRPRGDTDLLVPESQLRATTAVLDRLGYTRGHGVTGDFISYEAAWSREAGSGIVHHLDVHWRINNSQILARLLTCDELVARATVLPPLGPHARAPCAVHALLYACMHRAGHANAPYVVDGRAYLGGDRLIWLYDMHLLVTRMSDAEVTEFAAMAAARRLRAICRDALQQCVDRFGTPVPPSILAALAPDGDVEPSARYLSGGRTRQMIGDFLALEGASQRLRWLKELAFPPADYMRRKYSESAGVWLPVLYARRGLHGLWRLAAGTPDDRAG